MNFNRIYNEVSKDTPRILLLVRRTTVRRTAADIVLHVLPSDKSTFAIFFVYLSVKHSVNFASLPILAFKWSNNSQVEKFSSSYSQATPQKKLLLEKLGYQTLLSL